MYIKQREDTLYLISGMKAELIQDYLKRLQHQPHYLLIKQASSDFVPSFLDLQFATHQCPE